MKFLGDRKSWLWPIGLKAIQILGIVLLFHLFTTEAVAQSAPNIRIDFDSSSEPSDVALSLQILFLFSILSIAPGILIMVTSFTRIVIVLSFIRRALNLQQTPPNQVIVGLALFMTFFVMAPVWNEINTTAIQPYLNHEFDKEVRDPVDPVTGEEISEDELPFNIMITRAVRPIRAFMWSQIGVEGEEEVALLMVMAGLDKPDTPADVPLRVLAPAFMLSELQKAFIMGFLLFLPFLVIDIVIASVILSMGMFTLSPVLISLPFKILLFVMVDGWRLVIESLGVSILGA
ncbi:MAG: flagellar type III secretion system pore protein FliP [Candidatus Omnitrophica bacterium]|nr:flagellar type III secretion system pore protein FliP [Candidatus Omnitrophota bacterium]MCB9768159.1 flagellar type III secretion system pore protein FliP [Candidatus Omnitrophota bacterium]